MQYSGVALPAETRRKLARIKARRSALLADERRMIVEARRAGGSLREIAQAVGLSHMQIKRIIADEGDAADQPS